MKKAEIIEAYKKKYGASIHPNPLTDSELRMLDFCISIASALQESGEKTADINKFSDRLDEIFEQGDPTKAQIIDAFNKFSGQSVPEISDEEITMAFPLSDIRNFNAIGRVIIGFMNRSRQDKQFGARWYKSELAKMFKG